MLLPVEAAALATLGYARRRLLASLVRALAGRAVPDLDSLPERLADEPAIEWAARCVGATGRGERASPTALLAEAEQQLARGAAAGLRAVPFGDAEYPGLLAAIPDPPPLLWLRGVPAAFAAPAVAIVGSRAASPYGLEMARQLSMDLAARGVAVVSGLARGIDSAAHRAAVDAGGPTLAVLGSGLDRVYPPEHAGLAAEIVRQGALLSEFPPGTPPLPHHFPLRNRLISGVSSAVVVVEASEKSGSLITAACALEQGRDVMAVPGPVRAGRYRGAHALLRDGAKLVESADDILQELAGFRAIGVREPVAPPDDLGLGVTPEVVDFTVDDVSAWSGMSAPDVLARLLDLEMSGRIQRIGGGRFLRPRRPVLT